MKIPAWLEFAYKIALLCLLTFASAAHLAPDQFGGAVIAGKIAFWCTLNGNILSGIGIIVATGNVPSITAVGKVAALVLGIVASTSFIAPRPASAAVARWVHVPVKASTLGDPLQLVEKIRTWAASDAAADLAVAIKMAEADKASPAGSISLPCWKAINDYVSVIKMIPSGSALPKIHLTTDIEVLTELVERLQPNGPIMSGCAALAQFQVMSVNNMVTGIVTGALSLGKLAPVIP